MKKKLNCILLVDDNAADNYFHKIIIKEMNFTENIEVALDGEQALTFVKKENQIPPELIFLDINMPRMDGWGFLEAYRELSEEQKSDTIVIMLTTSLNPEDEKKAEQFAEVVGFKIKPLTVEMLTEILEQYFPKK
ncbi:MAG: response regulator [Flavobacteriales bacterium]|nr:response regulator [Flavobacteriales bacterium]